MLDRRHFALCALCAVTGFAAEGVEAETSAPAIKRTILQRTEGPTPDYEIIIAQGDIGAGLVVPRHIHPGVESAYVAEGEGVFVMDGAADLPIKAGDTVQVPARRPHSLKNGGKPMKIVSTYVVEKGQPLASPA